MIEIISSIFSNHNAMKLEINQKNTEKHAKTWKLNNMLLNNEWINNEIKEDIKTYFETNEDEDIAIQKSVGHWGSKPKREIQSITGLSHKTRKCSNKQFKFTFNKT